MHCRQKQSLYILTYLHNSVKNALDDSFGLSNGKLVFASNDDSQVSLGERVLRRGCSKCADRIGGTMTQQNSPQFLAHN